MRLLLDTHVLVAIAQQRLRRSDAAIYHLVTDASDEGFASTASLWEIAIKTRLGKLDPVAALPDPPAFFEAIGLIFVVINPRHAVTVVRPELPTRDPFNCLLLAQCEVEGLRLVTRDRALFDHPLA